MTVSQKLEAGLLCFQIQMIKFLPVFLYLLIGSLCVNAGTMHRDKVLRIPNPGKLLRLDRIYRKIMKNRRMSKAKAPRYKPQQQHAPGGGIQVGPRISVDNSEMIDLTLKQSLFDQFSVILNAMFKKYLTDFVLAQE